MSVKCIWQEEEAVGPHAACRHDYALLGETPNSGYSTALLQWAEVCKNPHL